MKQDLFREKALKKMFSREEISNYIKTSNLSMWLVFPAVTLLLLGFLFWGFCGEVQLHFSSVTVCENGKACCYIPEKHIDEIPDTASVQIDGHTYTISHIAELPVPASDHLSPYGIHLGNFEDDEWVYPAEIQGLTEDGLYRTDILTERTSPISLLLN